MRLAEAVRSQPERVLVTDQWWLPQTLASEFYEREMFVVETSEQIEALQNRLAGFGERRFLFVTTALERPIERGARVVDDAGLGFFSGAFFSGWAGFTSGAAGAAGGASSGVPSSAVASSGASRASSKAPTLDCRWRISRP